MSSWCGLYGLCDPIPQGRVPGVLRSPACVILCAEFGDSLPLFSPIFLGLVMAPDQKANKTYHADGQNSTNNHIHELYPFCFTQI